MSTGTRSEMHPSRWGDPAAAAPLPEPTRALVELAFGLTDSPAATDVSLPAPGLDEAVLDQLRSAVGDAHLLTDDATRRLRTRGKSTPDLLRARAGDLSDAPDVVVRPGGADEVEAVLAIAVGHHVAVVPFGGGTAVTGGLAPARDGYAGVISLDLRRMNHLVEVDPVSMTATLEPGLLGPEAEVLLAGHGLTLGHFPQSFEHASIGGFAATRSSGQASAGYGRFDAMVVALTAVTPTGRLSLGVAPASAAGPDLRQLLLGSEGIFGVITSVTLRVRPIPEVKIYEGWRFASFAGGRDAMRGLAQSGLLPTVLRLSDETETALSLAQPDEVGADSGGGQVNGAECLMIAGYEGTGEAVTTRRAAVSALLADLGGTPAGEGPGRAWVEGRFKAPYLRDSMLDVGVLVETLETATFWSRVERTYADVKAALEASLPGALVLCHVSHVYETGCSLYFTVAAKASEETWRSAKAAATDAMVAARATITHHHAVGTDHKPWLAVEIGETGVRMLRALKAELDPTGILNPGVLVP